MAEDTKTVSTKTEKNSSETKKASTGAWWKTTVEKPEKEKEAEKPKAKRGRPRKTSSTGTSSKSTPTKKAAANKTTTQLKKEESVEGAVVADSPVKPEAKQRKPAARKSSAKTKPAARKSAATKEAANAAETLVDPVSVSQSEEGEEKKEKKPARRGRPRKKPQAKKETVAQQKTATPSESDAKPGKTAVQDATQEGDAGAQPEVAETPGEAKKPARRGRPRKKPQASEVADAKKVTDKPEETVGSSDGETAQSIPVDDKPPAEKKKPARRGRPRKKPKAEETVAESQEKVDSEVAEPAEEKEKKTPRKPRPRRGSRKKKTEEPPQSSAEDISEGKSGDIQEESAQVDGSIAGTAKAAEPAEKGDDIIDEAQSQQSDEFETEEDADASPTREHEEKDSSPKPVLKLLINAEEPEECRLALLEDGRLESIHVATSTRTQTKNNIYKARIVAIEPNLQAAFVDYGTEKNGFLPFSEIHPEYYKENVTDKVQALIDQHQWKKLSITDVVEKGREVLVQVVKEEVGKKGANMTTYLSLPGRCVVLMPGSDSTGISRKISGEERRSKLREYIQGMEIPEGIGWIVRTASVDITKTALSRDVSYLLRLWDDVKKKGQDLNGVGLIYQDHDHVLRFLREHFDPDIQEILVDDKDALDQVKSFIELLPAKQRNVRCKLHRGARPIFNQYSIEDQIESIYQPKVNLPSGGSIVIDPTEALVAIDVNSGSTSKGQNFEETIFQANKEAAKELARQLRLRDLGGLIVVDFIDMRAKKNIREVEREIKTAMKRDKAKVDISRISKFGLMQISRQKLGAPIEAGNYRVCSNCKGRGIVRSVETLALYYLRRIHTAASRKLVFQIECRFPLDVAQYLLNNKRQEIRDLELRYKTDVVIIADPSYRPADFDLIYHKSEKDNANKKRS